MIELSMMFLTLLVVTVLWVHVKLKPESNNNIVLNNGTSKVLYTLYQ